MPRPNHPTDAEYDNALDKADFYRRKWLEIEAQRDDLLAALVGVMDMLDLCQHTGSIPERLANLNTWKDRTESAKAAINKAGGAK